MTAGFFGLTGHLSSVPFQHSQRGHLGNPQLLRENLLRFVNFRSHIGRSGRIKVRLHHHLLRGVMLVLAHA